jgi:hypothetical protein
LAGRGVAAILAFFGVDPKKVGSFLAPQKSQKKPIWQACWGCFEAKNGSFALTSRRVW